MIAALINHLWQSTVCVAAAVVLTLLLRRNSARIRYWIWFAASVKFLLPFSVLVWLGQLIAPTHITAELLNASRLPPALLTQSLTVPFAEVAPTAIEGTIPWQALIFAVWGVGALLTVAFWTARWWRMRRLVKSSRPLQIVVPVPVRSSPGLLEPGLVGVVHPVLLLPEGFVEQFSPAEIQSVLAHELCHLRRRDNLTYAVHLMSCAAFWFYPLVWWLGPRLIAERERACDEAVLASGHRAELYGGCILKVCRQYVSASVVGTCGVSGTDLQSRIRWIMSWRGAAAASFMQKALLTATAATIISAPLLLGAARAMTPAPAATQHKQVAIEEEQPAHTAFNPADFDKCAGFYQYADYRFYQWADFPVVARVYQENSRYYVQDTGQAPMELIPEGSGEGSAKFATKTGHKQYLFVMGPDGQAREMVTIRHGRVDDQAPRASKADWDAAAAKLQQRIAPNIPSPGTEAALRQQLEGWENRRSDYSQMPYVVSSTQEELEKPEHLRKTIDQLGTLTGLRFVKVNPEGWDVFDVQFSNGTLEFAVAALSPSGKFAGESYRLL